VFIPAGCGGAGGCGQCKVKVTEGNVEVLQEGKLDKAARAEGYVLACQTRVMGDLTVEVPTARAGRKAIPRDEALRMQQTATPLEPPVSPAIDPMTIRVLMELPPPSPGDNVCDHERLLRVLKTNHDIEPVRVGIDVLRQTPTALREGDWKITTCLELEAIPGTDVELHRVFRVYPGHLTNPPTAVAIDIGTTTLWGELVDLDTGDVLARASRYNPQIAMGEDVISRIVYALKGDGLNKLQSEVVRGLNEIIGDLTEQSGQPRDGIVYLVAAGNTVMTHLFLGLYPKFLRESPYVPVAHVLEPMRAQDLGLELSGSTFVRVMPGVASYVGGDIVSGVLANGMWNQDEMVLFIDIGTNGEIVIGNRELLMTASCSAGPAFEGGGLEFGMRAAPGAIESVLIDPESYQAMIKTIDGKPALGICGSGIINMVSQLLRTRILGRNGSYAADLGTDRVREGKSGMEYVVCLQPESGVDQDIVLTEVDLDNIVRAKGAMFSGYTCLLDKIGMDVSAIDKVIIAGAFGSFINLEHAVTIGLLPDIDRDKFQFMGNTSLKGARLCAIDRNLFTKAVEIAHAMTNVELAEDPSYMDNFMAALFLPHTRSELFPSVQL
jgi:uncharacterized 2Fe-2S/4Fe-4S cluster protein (DUF4445 family)